MACPLPPVDLRADAEVSCSVLDPKKAETTQCNELLIKCGEVQVEIEIELGYPQLTFGSRPRMKAKRIGAAKYEYKYDSPGYLGAALAQAHDYFCPAGEEFVEKPLTKTIKWRSYGGATSDVKICKKTPWEFFGWTSSNYGKNIDIRTDPKIEAIFTNESIKDKSGSLRADYFREAAELIAESAPSGGKGKLRRQEAGFEKYMNDKLIEYVDYTGTMMMIYSMAAAGNLSLEQDTRKFRIGDNATNPGTSRKVKMVFNLYFKIANGYFASNADTILTPIKLGGSPFDQVGVGHKKRSCLQAVVVLNPNDGDDNTKGIYYFGLSWGKANPAASFLRNAADGVLSEGKADPKGGFQGNYKATAGFQYGPDNRLETRSKDWVQIKDAEGFLTGVKSRIEALRIIKNEHDYSIKLAAAEGSPQQAKMLHQSYWQTPTDVKPIKLATPSVKQKGGGGWEITPGLNFYLTAGQNVTSGDIQGAMVQLQIIMPLETLAMLGDENLTLETLPGTLWNMWMTTTAVIKVDIIATAEGTYQIVNWYLKQMALKEEMEKMKAYAESVKTQMQAHSKDLANHFNNKDLAKYNQTLQKMKAIADDFYNRTKVKIDLTKAYELGDTLKALIDAQNALQNAPLIPQPDPVAGSSTAPTTEIVPESAGANFNAEPPIISPGGEGSALIIPGVDVLNTQPLTNNEVDPVVVTPSTISPNVSSAEALGVIGGAENFDDIEGLNNYPLEGFWDQ